MKIFARRLLFLTLFCSVAFPQSPGDDFRSLQVDASKVIGEIHSFQGLNGPPTPVMPGFLISWSGTRSCALAKFVRTTSWDRPKSIRNSIKTTHSSLG